MKMENNKIEVSRKQDFFHIEESTDDGHGCIHIPVTMPRIKGIPDVNIEIDQVISKVREKYKENEFNDKWDFISSSDGEIKEYLFFYEKHK